MDDVVDVLGCGVEAADGCGEIQQEALLERLQFKEWRDSRWCAAAPALLFSKASVSRIDEFQGAIGRFHGSLLPIEPVRAAQTESAQNCCGSEISDTAMNVHKHATSEEMAP